MWWCHKMPYHEFQLNCVCQHTRKNFATEGTDSVFIFPLIMHSDIDACNITRMCHLITL